MVKIDGQLNPADLMTKNLPRPEMEKYLTMLNIEFRAGRAVKAPHLYAMVEDKLFEERRRKEQKPEERRQGRMLKDYWVETNNGVRRVHLKQRRALFTPIDVDAAGCPRAWSAMNRSRLTEGTLEDGTPFMLQDNWTTPEIAHRLMRQRWTGTTTFCTTPS